MDSITLTLSIQISKKSAVKKLSRASKTFQHFKNLIYITALEYFKQTKSIKPFLSVSFLEKYIKGKEKLQFSFISIKRKYRDNNNIKRINGRIPERKQKRKKI